MASPSRVSIDGGGPGVLIRSGSFNVALSSPLSSSLALQHPGRPPFSIMSGSANRPLAEAIALHLKVSLVKTEVTRSLDGETHLQIFDSIRGTDLFLIQPTCPPQINDHLMELLLTLDSLKRSSPARITAVIPYFGYARQDRKHGPREPITAKLVADLISVAGAERVLFLDLHATQIQGFFDLPADNLRADWSFVGYLQEKGLSGENTTIIAPNAGGVRRAQRVAQRLKAKIAILESRTVDGKKVVNVVGSLQQNAVIIDDMLDTGKRLRLSAETLKANGVAKVFCCATHAVLSGNVQDIQDSQVDEIAVTDSIPVPDTKKFAKLRVLSVAPFIAEAIRRIHEEQTLSEMFLF